MDYSYLMPYLLALSSLCINPYAGGGYFHPKHKDAKIFENHLNLSNWYSLDSSHCVLSDEYPFTRVSVILRVFASFCNGQISHHQHKG